MAFYNLLGQTGPKGETNPDAPEAGPYIYFNEPPGRGDNKGLVKTSFGSIGVADEKAHNKKLEEAGLDPIPSDKDLSSTSFAPREEVEAKEVLAPATNSEINNVNNILDLAQLAFKKNISTTQKNKLIGLFGFDREAVESLILAGDTADEIDYITQLNEEDAFIRNIVNNNIAIAKAEEEKRDTRSLVEKETDFIKQYVENKNKAIDPGDVNYIEQLNEEMEYITNFVNNNVKPKVNQKLAENKSEDEVVEEVSNETAVTTVTITPTVLETETTQSNTFVPDNLDPIELNNIPVGAEVWDVDGTLYLAYAVPGAGDLYTGSTIWMAYDVVGNDLFESGLLTKGFEYKGPNGSPSKSWFDSTAILAGNTNQLIGMDSDPFASFVETYKEEALLRPWLLDNQFIELQAEAALENRDISEAEWRATTWYQTNNQAKRDWMDIELSDPAEAQRQRDDLELYYKNQLQGLGVSNVPDGLIQWVTSQNITGTWSDLKTAEQLQLFADPYKTGERDTEMLNLISTSGFGDVDRTAAREKEVVELYRKWLGPSLGSLTQDEVASIAGRLRDDPDYEDALVNSLKQSRLAAFSNYTNPELTYEDIARPWRNLTTSVWGQTADETQGWWQEMVKSNDYSTAQTTLREKGLEQNINQVSIDASQALQNALGQGSISQTGVNV